MPNCAECALDQRCPYGENRAICTTVFADVPVEATFTENRTHLDKLREITSPHEFAEYLMSIDPCDDCHYTQPFEIPCSDEKCIEAWTEKLKEKIK